MEGPITILLASAIIGVAAGWRGKSGWGLTCAGALPALGVVAFIAYAEYVLSGAGFTHYEKDAMTVLIGQAVIAAIAGAVGVALYLIVSRARHSERAF